MDMILHFTVGLLVTLVLLTIRVSIGTIFLVVLVIAISKEIYDTQYTIDILENIKDIFFTILPVGLLSKRESKWILKI